VNSLKDALLHIPDTQGSRDDRQLVIRRVGIKDVRYPLQLRISPRPDASVSSPAVVHTVAQWDLDVSLPADRKGTHMSRFVAWLDALREPLDAPSLRVQMADMLQRLEAREGRVEARFPFFLRKRAPVSGVESLLEYNGAWIAEARHPADAPPSVRDTVAPVRVWAKVVVPVKTLCPCSKEISDYGAHNQRSHVTLLAELREPVDWTELVRFAEDQASSELWPMLKRADEKWVTETADENPKFVEDLIRDVALGLNRDPRIGAYRLEVENFESIHAHSAYAQIVRD
jgi:GTP cyclohydrolase IB